MDFRVAYFTNIDNVTHSLGDGKKNYIKFKIFCQKNKECEKVITSDVFCQIWGISLSSASPPSEVH